MKTVAFAATLVLTTVALASPSLAQTLERGRPFEPNTAPPPAAADSDRGTVISVTPIVRQVAVARRICNDEAVAVQRQPSGAGALIGAVAGGAMGNAIGAGAGRAAATAIGVIGGALVGNSIESGGPAAQAQSVRRCTTEKAYEDRTGAYSVVYEYAGRQYTTQMQQDPGRSVRVQVQAAPEDEMASPQYAPPARARSALPQSSRPPPRYVERPVYRDDPDYRDPPEPVYRTYPAPARVYYEPAYYEPAYPQFGTGLVLGALIGYGAHYGAARHYRHGWRPGR